MDLNVLRMAQSMPEDLSGPRAGLKSVCMDPLPLGAAESECPSRPIPDIGSYINKGRITPRPKENLLEQPVLAIVRRVVSCVASGPAVQLSPRTPSQPSYDG